MKKKKISTFWDIVDKHYNEKIFENEMGNYKLKNPMWGQEKLETFVTAK